MKSLATNCVFVLLAIFAANALSFAQTPAEIEKNLASALAEIVEHGSYAGNYDEDKSDDANERFVRLLIDAAKRADVLGHPFNELKDEMFITTSADGNLRIYSWDTNTGGTMRAYSSLFQFKNRQRKIDFFIDSTDEFVGDAFYHNIFQVKAGQNTVYLATSTFIGSTSLHGQSISAIEISDRGLNFDKRIFRTAAGLKNSIGFSYDFFSVYEREERPIKLFEFDQKSKILKFPVVIEDDKTPQGRVTDKWIKYKFNGKEFVKTK